MKSCVKILALIIGLAQTAFAGNPIQEFPLDDRRVYQIAVSPDRVTTISFPGPISAIDAAQVTVDGKSPALFQIAHTKGSYFLSVRALAKKVVTNVNVRWNNRTYALELRESDQPVYSVIFEDSSEQARRRTSVAVTPERLLVLLDKAKAFPLLKQFHPEAVEDVEYANFANKLQATDFKSYAVRIEEAFRFNPEDTLIFRVTLTNRTVQPLRYRPDGFSLRVGERVYPQSISDAAGSIPPNGTAPAYFAVTGTPDGGRNDISLKNSFTVILDAIPIIAGPAELKTNSTPAAPPDSAPEDSVDAGENESTP